MREALITRNAATQRDKTLRRRFSPFSAPTLSRRQAHVKIAQSSQGSLLGASPLLSRMLRLFPSFFINYAKSLRGLFLLCLLLFLIRPRLGIHYRRGARVRFECLSLSSLLLPFLDARLPKKKK